MVKPLYALAMWGFLGCLPAWCPAQDSPSDTQAVLPVSAFFADESCEVFRLSPDGHLVAFLKFDGTTSRLSVGDPRNLADTSTPVTGKEDGSVFSFLWVDDSRIAFTSRLPDQQTRIGCVQLPDARSGKKRQGIQVKKLSPEANTGQLSGILVRGKTNEILVSCPAEKGDGVNDIFAVDPSTGKRELIHRNVESLPVWAVSRNGKALVGIRCLPDGQKELVGVGSGKARVLLTCRADESVNIASVDPDGTVVYIVTDQGNDVQFTRLEEVNLNTGKRTVVGEDPLHDVDLCDAFFDRETNRPLACRFYRDISDYVWHSSELEERYNEIKSRFPVGDIRLQDSSRDGKAWLISVANDTEPDAEFFYESATKNLVRLDSRAIPIPAGNLGRMKPVRYKARDNGMISAYLTMPAGSAESHLPVVVFPHGGPNKRNYWGYDARVQFFASRGYAVFQPNFRGSSGYGKDFQNAGNAQWGRGLMQDDISDGVEWLIENGIADPKRIAIVGGSYGGFAALAGLAFTPDLYACGVSLFAASNLPDFVRETPEDWMPFFGDLAAKVGNPSLPEDARRLARQSPVNFTHQIKVPVMVYHGAKDRLIRQSQADRFVSACRSSGVNVDYLLSPSGGHGFTDPLDEQAVYIAIERFLSEHIGGRRQQDVPRNVEDRLAELRLTGDAALGSRTGGLPNAGRLPVPRFPAKAKVLGPSASSGNRDGRPRSHHPKIPASTVSLHLRSRPTTHLLSTFRYLPRHADGCKSSA